MPETPRCQLLLFVGPTLRPDGELGAVLARAGWRCLWLAGADAALRAATHARFDALVVQSEAGGGPPARQIDALRQALACPVLVVADSADEVDEIIALEFGADAYLAGVLAPRRLRAHLQALLRRRSDTLDAARPGAPQRLQLGDWQLDPEHRRLWNEERQVALTELQVQLLQVLGSQTGQVVPRATLADALAPGRALHVRSVDVYVARLRRRLREQRVDSLCIDGVRGRGYTLDFVAAPTPGGLAAMPWLTRRGGLGRASPFPV
jgi:DNA-binding response OmpR family regulator